MHEKYNDSNVDDDYLNSGSLPQLKRGVTRKEMKEENSHIYNFVVISSQDGI